MAQNREPPAYQEYAATVMAKLQYRTMTLEQRGLLYTMKLECWVNESLPRDSDNLAKVLGFSVDEIERCLPGVAHFFQLSQDEIRSKELDDYRTHLQEIRKKQAAGGRKGAAAVNQRKNSSLAADLSSIPQVDPRALSTDNLISAKYSQPQPLENAFDEGVVSFVSAYENKELESYSHL